MKALAIIDAIELSGPGKGLLQLVESAREHQVEILIANFTYEGRRSLFNEAAAARGIRCVPLHTRARFEMRVLRQLEQLVRDESIDIIQSHSFKPLIYALLLRKRLRMPWLAFAHGWTNETWRVRINNALERRLLRYADHVIVLSEVLEKDLRAHGRRGPLSLVLNAITQLPPAPTAEQRAAARARFGLRAQDWAMACVGRLSHEKAQDVLLEALPELQPRAGTSAVLLLAGDGPYRARFEALVPALAGRVDVRFLGHVSDVSAVYDACDLLVMPSRSEGTPNAILEAMSHGLPIVATRVGSVPIMVEAGRDALLVDAEDRAALTRDLQRLHDDFSAGRELAATLGANARRAVWPRFSAKARAATVVDIYRNLLPASESVCASP